MSARKILTPDQKVAILREHLIEKVPVSQVCDKQGVSVINFDNWQKQLFEKLDNSEPKLVLPNLPGSPKIPSAIRNQQPARCLSSRKTGLCRES